MITRTLTTITLALTAILALASAESRQEAPRECEARLKKDVTFLASPACEGRGPRTRGLKKAGDYLAAEFERIGLAPAFGDSYFQSFTLPATKAEVTLTGPQGQVIELQQDVHFTPLGLSQRASGKGGVVFVGHGFVDEKAGYDDYADVDVKGKVVVLLTGQPRTDATATSGYLQQNRLGSRVEAAEEHGAAAVIVVNESALAQ